MEEKVFEEITPSEELRSEGILTQEEIDALLRAQREGLIEKKEEEKKSEDKIKRYNFRESKRFFSRMRFPSINLIHSRFANSARMSVSSLLQKIVDINLISVRGDIYRDFIYSVPLPAEFAIISMKPLKGRVVFIFEMNFVTAVIDILLGGEGKPLKPEGRDLTRIEQRLLRRVVSVMLRNYQDAWEPIYKISPEIESIEGQPQFVNIAVPEDFVVVAEFSVDFATFSSKMMIGIPYSTLEPIRNFLQSDYQSSKLEKDYDWLQRMITRLSECPVLVKAELGRAKITLRELLALKKGDIVKLDTDINTPTIVYVQDVPKYLGVPGKIGDTRAILIEKVIKNEEELRENVLNKLIQ